MVCESYFDLQGLTETLWNSPGELMSSHIREGMIGSVNLLSNLGSSAFNQYVLNHVWSLNVIVYLNKNNH